MSRNINAPGYQIDELDMSQYSRSIDNSFDNAPACLVLGYGAKGASSIPRWINIPSTFTEYFGHPEIEEERYFYNTAQEVLRRNGVCIAAKLPYDNSQSQKYVAATYTISLANNLSDALIQHVMDEADSTISTALKFELKNSDSSQSSIKLIDKSMLENYIAQTIQPELNTMVVVDVQKTMMDKTAFKTVETDGVETDDCLGIMPVVFTAANAMFYQNIISSNISPLDGQIAFRNIEEDNETIIVDADSVLSNLAMDLSTDNVYDNAVANLAESQYPTIQWKDESTLLRTGLKYVGVAVFKAYADKANDGKIAFKLVECFVGSPSRIQTPQSSLKFIDDIVNSQSTYINIFTNIRQSDFDAAAMTYAYAQKAPMLGFYEAECKKTVPTADKIVHDVSEILSKLENPNMLPIDIVIDAGTSTIAFNNAVNSSSVANNDTGKSVSELTSMDNMGDNELNDRVNAWFKLLQQYNQFCARARKDCMFIADIPRSFCLNGQAKIVNPLSSKTVKNNIISKLKKLKRINTSYGAGYATWLYAPDAYSGQYFWMPPSIKAASSYIYCDTYFHPWSAPAGLTRGVVSNVVDVAFNPTKQECEQLYMNGWNYILSYPMSGIVIEGQKTFQSEATALDRVNVRRLMLSIEQSVAFIAKYFTYESNTPYQRQLFTDRVNAILTEVRNGNGISEFAVKCDDTNNTPETIDRNELHLSVAVKPVKTIEFIILQFALTSQSMDVQEVVSKL